MSQHFGQDSTLKSLSLNFDMIDPGSLTQLYSTGYLYTSSYVVLDIAVTKIQILTHSVNSGGMLDLFDHKNVYHN